MYKLKKTFDIIMNEKISNKSGFTFSIMNNFGNSTARAQRFCKLDFFRYFKNIKLNNNIKTNILKNQGR